MIEYMNVNFTYRILPLELAQIWVWGSVFRLKSLHAEKSSWIAQPRGVSLGLLRVGTYVLSRIPDAGIYSTLVVSKLEKTLMSWPKWPIYWVDFTFQNSENLGLKKRFQVKITACGEVKMDCTATWSFGWDCSELEHMAMFIKYYSSAWPSTKRRITLRHKSS